MEKPKRKRRTKEQIRQDQAQKVYSTSPEGLGDTIEAITEATGIKKLVHWLAGDDCGCEERKELLNKLFPYKKPKCMTEDEFNYFSEFLALNTKTIRPTQQMVLLKMYNRIFGLQQEPTSCADCWRDFIHKLTKVHSTYADTETK
jgi:tyrosine-protein phosphatase YwqE